MAAYSYLTDTIKTCIALRGIFIPETNIPYHLVCKSLKNSNQAHIHILIHGIGFPASCNFYFFKIHIRKTSFVKSWAYVRTYCQRLCHAFSFYASPRQIGPLVKFPWGRTKAQCSTQLVELPGTSWRLRLYVRSFSGSHDNLDCSCHDLIMKHKFTASIRHVLQSF